MALLKGSVHGDRASGDLSINAIAILLVEPHYFDDEKEKAAQRNCRTSRETCHRWSASAHFE